MTPSTSPAAKDRVLLAAGKKLRTKADLAHRAMVSPSTCSWIVNLLVADGELEEGGETITGRRGRPAKLYRLAA